MEEQHKRIVWSAAVVNRRELVSLSMGHLRLVGLHSIAILFIVKLFDSEIITYEELNSLIECETRDLLLGIFPYFMCFSGAFLLMHNRLTIAIVTVCGCVWVCLCVRGGVECFFPLS